MQYITLAMNIFAAIAGLKFMPHGETTTQGCRIKVKFKGDAYEITSMTIKRL